MIRTIDIPDLAATEAFGRRLGELLFPGAVVALVGQLGAGKTHLTRAVAEGLGVKNPAAVNSPTFVLIQEYPARLPIYHFDAYRLSGPREFAELGVDEYFRGDGVCLVEWADKVEVDAARRSPAHRDRDRGREPPAVSDPGDRQAVRGTYSATRLDGQRDRVGGRTRRALSTADEPLVIRHPHHEFEHRPVQRGTAFRSVPRAASRCPL